MPEDKNHLASNIEIKAKVKNPLRLEWLAQRLSDTPCEVLHQQDTFFCTTNGRLKLRVFGDGKGELIYYSRNDSSGPKHSSYVISRTSDPDSLKQALSLALGIKGTVQKKRSLYIVGQTRIHLDDVEGLGHFVELEFVVQPNQTMSEGTTVVEELMKELEITSDDLVEGAYLDIADHLGTQQ